MKNQQHQSVYSRLMSDFGRRDKKGDKNNDYTIEEQIVLRVPPAIAEGVRQMLKGKQNNVESDLSFQMSSERKGEMLYEGKKYPLTLVDLPCVIESHKTLDRRTFYKSADVHQMILVEDPYTPTNEEGAPFKPSFDAEWRLDTGLTRLTRHIRTKRWRRHPYFPPHEVREIAEELSKMKRGAPVPDRYEYVEITEAMHAPPAVAPVVAKPVPSFTLKTSTASNASPSVSTPTVTSHTPIAHMTAPEMPISSTPAKLTVSLPQSTPIAAAPSLMTPSTPLAHQGTISVPSTPATPATPSQTPSGGGIFKFKFGSAKKAAPIGEDASATPTSAAAATPSTGPKFVISAPSMVPAAQPVSASLNVPTVAPTIPSATTMPTTTTTAPSIGNFTNPNAMAVDVAPPPSIPTESSAPAPSANSAEYEMKLNQRTQLARQKVSEEAQLAKQIANAQNEKNVMMKKRMQQSATDIQARIKKLEEQIAQLDQALQAFGV